MSDKVQTMNKDQLKALEESNRKRRERMINSIFGCKQGSFRNHLKKVDRPTKRTIKIEKNEIPNARRMLCLGDDQAKYLYFLRKEA